MRRAAGVLVLILLVAPLAAKEEEDPRKVFLAGIGKAIKGGGSATIAAHFPEEGKVELRLKGLKEGRYRDEHARSLLASWFGRIEPREVKLREIRGSAGVFRLKYRLRADGTEVESLLHVYFERKGESWQIVGIVES